MRPLRISRHVLRFVVAAALVLGGAPAHAQAAADVLGPGDMLRVTVFRRPELSAEMEVAADGTLLHPLYRELRVVGADAAELDRRVREFLLRYESDPRFVAEPLVRVTLGGEVRLPANVTVRPHVTALQAVSQAGGANERGDLKHVLLYRDGVATRLDLSRPDTEGARTVMRSGDLLVVQRRVPGVREWLTPLASLLAVAVGALNLLSNP